MSEPKKPQDHKPKQGQITVQGIALSIPIERLQDWDVVEGVAIMQDETVPQAEKLVASVQVMRRVFGEDYPRVKTELRQSHDGELDAEIMAGFLTGVFKELNPSA